ncbi:hypothetical protein AMS68_003123 [Peltaster fructicola]|uniref:Prolyl 4-hydroxylase alpha subunit domain-containing protein n=1 Tax=Peltaster fructicola TaxID=286661 RepID=A0A6H0XSF4_9PEZI|nr:hypothetical protein AMS68_003123 [Peltaster fructicola]
MGRMLNLRSRYSDFLSPKSMLGGDKNRSASPEVELPAVKRDSMSPCSSVESTPKSSMDEESPAITVTPIAFAHESLPEYDGMYAIVIDNVLSRQECAELRQEAEESTNRGWERAMVNIGNGQQALYTDTRNCGRIIWDSQEVVDRIWNRISDLPELKEILRLQNNAEVTGNGPARRNEVWEFTRPNERMRFLKYVQGEYFRPHCDGTYETPDRSERSYYTMQLYMNDQGPPTSQSLRGLSKEERKLAQKNYLQGGNTAFHSYDGQRRFNVAPKAGSVLIFQHRNLLHSGTDVLQGTKYTMRTDLMYRKV